jgi:hypothetical protein
MAFNSEKRMFAAELKRAPRLLSSLLRNNPLLEDFRGSALAAVLAAGGGRSRK